MGHTTHTINTDGSICDQTLDQIAPDDFIAWMIRINGSLRRSNVAAKQLPIGPGSKIDIERGRSDGFN